MPTTVTMLTHTLRLTPTFVGRSTGCSIRRLSTNVSPPGKTRGTMPPGYTAKIGALETFVLPDKVTDSKALLNMGKAMIKAWQRDGILQVCMTPEQKDIYDRADKASRDFFALDSATKQACVDEKSYSGYIASGEEITDGIADYSEIFTVTKDLPESDPRVQAGWPCHGPCPWPNEEMKTAVSKYMSELGGIGEKLLGLLELGLDLRPGLLTEMTEDGWHHMRVLRFPATHLTNGKGKDGRGIGSHSDYGLLVIAAQDEIGGLFIREPDSDENYANWQESNAGLNENDNKWVYVPPMPGVLTVFPGDMMQYMTNNKLPSTLHKVGLNTDERFALAYFHEPNFKSVLKPLPGHGEGLTADEGVHYGTHFTNMFLRNYPERITTKRMEKEGTYAMLNDDALRQGFT